MGTNEKSNIVELVEKFIEEKIKLEDVQTNKNETIKLKGVQIDKKANISSNVKVDDVFQNAEYCEFGSVTYTENTRAVIKVQDGCDRFCSYCMIPYARGRVRSRNPENVISEVKELVGKGFKEVVITGIHVASYGKDFKNGYELIDLLEEINKIQGLERIRLRVN